MGWRAVTALLVVPVLILGACGGDGKESEPVAVCPSKESAEAAADVSGLTLEQVYERMAEAMTCPGYALHVALPSEAQYVFPEDNKLSRAAQDNMWVDLAGGRARKESHATLRWTGQYGEIVEDREDRVTAILVGDTVYSMHQYGADALPGRGQREADLCEGSQNHVVSWVLMCDTGVEGSTTRFEPVAEYEGRRMPALITEGESHSEIGDGVFTYTSYLDEGTLLPVLAVLVSDAGPSEHDPQSGAWHATYTTNYEYEFVSLDSLAQDFFDPASIQSDSDEPVNGVGP